MNYRKIKHIADSKGISVNDLCIRAGITSAGFYKMIHAKSMKVSVLENLCKVLDICPAVFFQEEGVSGMHPESTLPHDLHEERKGERISINQKVELKHLYEKVRILESELEMLNNIIKLIKDI